MKDALRLMAEKGIGAVVVVDGGRVRGILSERDCARKVELQGRTAAETAVSDVMTRYVSYVPPWRTVDECMALMTGRRFRHLPVVEEGRMVGIVSIGDVVKAFVDERDYELRELEAYVDEVLLTRGKADAGEAIP